MLREDLVSGNVFILDILQVHLTAVDRCLAVQLSNQTADISVTDNSGVGQTDIFQFAAKGLEQACIAGVLVGIRTLFCLNGQITDLRMIYPASAVIAFELSVFDWCKFSVEIQIKPAIAFIALELDIPLLHRGGDDLVWGFFVFQSGIFPIQILQMPSVLDHRRPAVGSAEPAGSMIPDLREQAVGGNGLGGSLDLVVLLILHPDRHRQVFAGD